MFESKNRKNHYKKVIKGLKKGEISTTSNHFLTYNGIKSQPATTKPKGVFQVTKNKKGVPFKLADELVSSRFKKGPVQKREMPSKEEEVKKEVITFRGKDYEIFCDNFIVNDYVFDPEHIPIIKVILNAVESGKGLNVLALGDAGTGKTSFAKALSSYFGIDHHYVNCSVVRNPVDWLGQREIKNKSTLFEPSNFTKFIESGNGIAILDEINRTQENNRGPLLSLLDDTKHVSVYNEDIYVGDGMIFYGTANIGWDYTGTYGFDKAEQDRFVYVKFKEMSLDREIEILVLNGTEEGQAEEIVTSIIRLRNALRSTKNNLDLPYSLGVRTSLKLANCMNVGLSFKEAAQICLLNALDSENLATVQNIIRGNY